MSFGHMSSGHRVQSKESGSRERRAIIHSNEQKKSENEGWISQNITHWCCCWPPLQHRWHSQNSRRASPSSWLHVSLVGSSHCTQTGPPEGKTRPLREGPGLDTPGLFLFGGCKCSTWIYIKPSLLEKALWSFRYRYRLNNCCSGAVLWKKTWYIIFKENQSLLLSLFWIFVDSWNDRFRWNNKISNRCKTSINRLPNAFIKWTQNSLRGRGGLGGIWREHTCCPTGQWMADSFTTRLSSGDSEAS